jgi:hypothetical protein
MMRRHTHCGFAPYGPVVCAAAAAARRNLNVMFYAEETRPDDTCRGARLWLSGLRPERGATP